MKSPKSRPTETGTLIGVRLQEGVLARVDEWRKQQPDLPTRPEAMRRMIEAYREPAPDTLAPGPMIRALIAQWGDRVDLDTQEEREQVNEAIKRSLALPDDRLQIELDSFVEGLVSRHGLRRRRKGP
jgi:hypothetical protein